MNRILPQCIACLVLCFTISAHAQPLVADFLDGARSSTYAFACSEDESRLLISVAGWGVWRSNDGGTSWTDVTAAIDAVSDAQFGSVSVLEAWDANADTVLAKLKFAPAEDWEFVITEDGGDTWRAVDPGHNYHWETFLCIQDCMDHDHLIHMTHMHINHSYDLGRTWTASLNYDPDNYPQKHKLLQDQWNPSTLYLTSWAFSDDQPCGIYRSEDYGDTWASVLTNPHELTGYYFLELRDMVQLDSQTLIVPIATGREIEHPHWPKTMLNQFLVSQDGGDTWVVQTDLLPVEFSPCQLELSGTGSDALYSINDHPQYHRGLAASEGWPQPLERITLGDGDRNTTMLTKNNFSGHVYVALSGGGVYRLNLSGEPEPIPLPANLGRVQHFWADGDMVYCSGKYDEVLESYSVDMDQWTELSSAHEEPVYKLRTPFRDGDDLYCIGEDEEFDQQVRLTVYRYDPGQQIWVQDSGDFENLWNMSHGDVPQQQPGNPVYDWLLPAYGEYGLRPVVHSVDTDSWEVYPTELDAQSPVYEIAATNDSLFAFSVVHNVYFSCSRYPEWTNLWFPDTGQLSHWSRIDWQAGNLIVLARHAVFTWDGDTWTDQPLPVDFSYAAICRDQPGTFALLTEDPFALYLTEDSGESWFDVPLQWPVEFQEKLHSPMQLDFNGPQELYLATSLGMLRMDLTQLGVDPEPVVRTFELSFTSYPNPFNSSSTIRYTLDKPGTVSLAVYDVLGRRVANLRNGPGQAGRHTVTLDAGGLGLSSGVYVLRLDAGGQILNRKITLVK